MSGDVGTNPWSTTKAGLRGGPATVRAAGAVPSGIYTMWQEPNALAVGAAQAPIPGRDAFNSLQQCLDACDEDQRWVPANWRAGSCVASDGCFGHGRVCSAS